MNHWQHTDPWIKRHMTATAVGGLLLLILGLAGNGDIEQAIDTSTWPGYPMHTQPQEAPQ